MKECWPSEDSQRVPFDESSGLPADFRCENRLPTHHAEDSRLQQSWARHRNPQQARLLARAACNRARLSSINPSLVGSKGQLSDRGGIHGRHNLARTGRSVEPGRGARPSEPGAGERSRTPDLRITNALLYQLSYAGFESAGADSVFWCSWAGSNRRPLPYQGSALPTELQERGIKYRKATRP